MITEKGTIKVRTEMGEDVTKELNRTSFILSIIYTVVGGVLLLLYIILQTFIEEFDSAFDSHLVLCFIGAILLVFGIIALVSCKKTAALAREKQEVEEHEFFGDHFICREYSFGEQISVTKFYYGRILRKKETKNFIFLYNTRVTAVAIDKRTVEPNEMAAIRSLLTKIGSPACKGPQSVQFGQPAAPYAPYTPVETHSAPPPDPFGGVNAKSEPAETYVEKAATVEEKPEAAAEEEPVENPTETAETVVEDTDGKKDE